MNRNITVLILCGLFLLADALCIERTVAIRTDISNVRLAMLVIGQVLTAVFIASIAGTLLRKNYRRQKKPVRLRRGFAVLQPLRRLFVSVWS